MTIRCSALGLGRQRRAWHALSTVPLTFSSSSLNTWPHVDSTRLASHKVRKEGEARLTHEESRIPLPTSWPKFSLPLQAFMYSALGARGTRTTHSTPPSWHHAWWHGHRILDVSHDTGFFRILRVILKFHMYQISNYSYSWYRMICLNFTLKTHPFL